MEYFTRSAYEAAQTPKGRKAWQKLEKDYTNHLRSIQPRLEGDWAILAEEDFTEETISSLERPSFDQVSVELDNYTLVFLGVREARLPEVGDEPADWLCHELHITEDDLVELKVLLGEDEFRVRAESVQIINADENRMAA